MAFDGHRNLSYSTVATAPSPASSGLSLVVASSDGSKFPATPFNAIVWPVGAQATQANSEIVRVTVRSTDTFTITRTQESTSARTIVVGDQIAATITAKVITDIETNVWTVPNGGTGDTTLTAHGVLIGNGASAVSVTGTGTTGQLLTSNGASADPTFQTLTSNDGTIAVSGNDLSVSGNALLNIISRQYFK